MDAPDREPVTVTADGITVRKTLNLEDFETLAIVYEVRSSRDDDTRIHVEDSVPAGISTEDVGFHPAHEPTESSIAAESVSFEVQLEPSGGATIILGINNHPEDELEVLTGEPTVELLATEAITSENVSIGEASNPERTGGQFSSGGVVRVLANELRREDVGDEARRLLGDELLDTVTELEDQLSGLEERVEEFEEFQRPIEEFLRDNGPAERVFSTFRDELSDIERKVETIQARTDEGVTESDTVRDRIDNLEDDIERADGEIATLEETLGTIRDEIGDIDDRMASNEDQADEVSDSIRDDEQRAGDLEESVAGFEEELQSIRERIRGDIRAIETDLEEFETFRDRLSAAFGGEEGSLDLESDDG